MRGKKLQSKGRAILRAKSTIRPPAFNIMDYNTSMVRALNYYSAEVENKDKRTFAYQYWKTQGKNVAALNDLPDAWFSTVGAVAHMALTETPLSDHDLIRLDSAYTQLYEKAVYEKSLKVNTAQKDNVAPKKSIQDYMDEAAANHIGEIEHASDLYMFKGTDFNVKTYLQGNQVKSPIAKRIADFYKTKLDQYNNVLKENDKEYIEGYGGKRFLNKLIAFIETIVTDCNTMAQIAKTTRAPRKRKEKPASVLVMKMKWLREFLDFGLKSVHPEKIVGSDMVIFYDTVKRKLIKYESMDGYNLTVKGTTLLNWNPEKSGSKIVRKPEVQLKGIQSMTKRPINNLFNEIKATSGRVNGRTNENLIIVGVY